MKILIHGINFDPEPTGIGKYSTEMVASLAQMGHEVRVVTAPPYYPAWKISEGWGNAYSFREWQHGVKVWRAPLWVPAVPNGTKRVIHLMSYSLAAIPQMLRQVAWRPDVVMVVAPALACAPWAWLTARLSGARAWLHVQDFEVDAAFELGMLRSHGRRRAAITRVERWLLARFDRVSTISGRMLDKLREKGVPNSRMMFLPNWVDDEALLPFEGVSPFRAELGIPADAKVALFAGSLGRKQGLAMIPHLARALAHRQDVYVVVAGDGLMKGMLERECAGMANVRLLPLQPKERLKELLALADIHLLTQNSDVADLVMPSKLTGMLASGRPVVTTAHAGTELAQVVARCGRVVTPDQVDELAAALLDLADDAAARAALGAEARAYAEEHLARGKVLKRLDQCLRACAKHSSAGVELAGQRPQTSAKVI